MFDVEKVDGHIIKSYKIKEGISKQYLALDLLEKNGYNSEMIQEARTIFQELVDITENKITKNIESIEVTESITENIKKGEEVKEVKEDISRNDSLDNIIPEQDTLEINKNEEVKEEVKEIKSEICDSTKTEVIPRNDSLDNIKFEQDTIEEKSKPIKVRKPRKTRIEKEMK
jgi:DNA mismatch repair ATPase MutS